MRALHTVTVQSAHAYTRSNVPWEVAGPGVMRSFGRTVPQMEAARRQRRFALFAVAFAVVWFVLYVF